MVKQLRLRMLAIKAITLGLALLVGFGFIEVTLRSFPGFIGIAVLAHFEPQLRGEIAERLGLPTLETAIKITPEMRTDGGPTIFLPAPGSLTVTYADAVDVELGAVEQVQVDDNGLCNDPDEARQSRADVFMAGDSFTFCSAVTAADTASHQLQAMSGFHTYNLGVRGIGPDEYLEMMKLHAPAFRPRVAVMNIYEGNDLRDILRKNHFLETGEERKKSTRDGRLVDEVISPASSYAVQFLKASIKLAVKKTKRWRLGKGNIDFRYSAMVGGKSMPMNVANRDKDEVIYARKLQNGEVSLDVFERPLAEFLTWADESDILPIVTYIPSMYTAYAATVEFVDPEVGKAVKVFSDAQRQRLARHAKALGYHFLDLTGSFQKLAAEGIITHFPSNVHLTPKGHEVVARNIFKLLRDLRFSPESN